VRFHSGDVEGGSNMTGTDFFFVTKIVKHLLGHVSLQRTPLTRAGGRVEVVASLSQGRTADAQCGLFTHKSVRAIFEPPCSLNLSFHKYRYCDHKQVRSGESRFSKSL